MAASPNGCCVRSKHVESNSRRRSALRHFSHHTRSLYLFEKDEKEEVEYEITLVVFFVSWIELEGTGVDVPAIGYPIDIEIGAVSSSELGLWFWVRTRSKPVEKGTEKSVRENGNGVRLTVRMSEKYGRR
jgi:hypothetical protein